MVSVISPTPFSPTLDPPPTEFICPKSNNEESPRSERVESATTLCEEGSPLKAGDPAFFKETTRGSLSTASKFTTEPPSPVALRPSSPPPQARSTCTQPV